jgi:hypothetical protein
MLELWMIPLWAFGFLIGFLSERWKHLFSEPRAFVMPSEQPPPEAFKMDP